MDKTYFRYHVHSSYSLCDSTTDFKKYVDAVAAEGGKAIAFTEHGNIFEWTKKKQYCDKKGIKFVCGIEAYLTLGAEFGKIKDNYHVVLLAKNYKGVQEINMLFSNSYEDDHYYYKPRITFDEFLNISDNVITTSACLGGPLYQIPKTIDKLTQKKSDIESSLKLILADYNKLVTGKNSNSAANIKKANKFEKQIEELKSEISNTEKAIEKMKESYIPLLKKFNYLEVQHHPESEEQKKYNVMLYKYAKKYGKKLIAGTDTHSFNAYEAECRKLFIEEKFNKGKVEKYPYEDCFDLTWKSYDELVECFKKQNALPEAVYLQAIDETNRLAEEIEDFELDRNFKYNDIPGVEDTKAELMKRINERFIEKKEKGIIPQKDCKAYLNRIREEFRVLNKIGMTGFILFMSNLMTWIREQKIPVSPCRGSVGGCLIAYIVDIIDLDPIQRNTVFSRFANEDRIELGDIDIDIPPDQRHLVYDYIISSYPETQTAYIITFTTQKALGTIDLLGRVYKDTVTPKETEKIKEQFKENYRTLTEKFPEFFEECKETLGFGSDAEIEFIKTYGKAIKAPNEDIDKIVEFHKRNSAPLRTAYPNFAKYYNGLFGVPFAQSVHPAGIVVAPSYVNLPRDYGVFQNDGKRIISIDMDECHDVSLVKYDILGLKQMQILRITCETAKIRVPLSYEMNWEDPVVWKHMMDSPVGLFQFEGRHNCSH